MSQLDRDSTPVASSAARCNSAASSLLAAYKLVELDDRVGEPEARTFFRARAERTARRRNAQRLIPSYRYEVVREGWRWAVVPFQNQLQPSASRDRFSARG